MLRLFREAAQRKTVGPVRREAGVECRHVEAQVQATVVVARIVGRGSPAATVVADVPQRALAGAAVARGGFLCLFREATQRKTEATSIRIVENEPRHTEAQVYAVGVAN